MAEKEKQTEAKIEVTQVATQTDVAYQLPNGDVLSLPEYLVWLGNEIQSIKKAIT